MFERGSTRSPTAIGTAIVMAIVMAIAVAIAIPIAVAGAVRNLHIRYQRPVGLTASPASCGNSTISRGQKI